MTANPSEQLIDRFGRQVTYLRISVTDRCDLRCIYCMTDDMRFVPRTQLLTLEEIETIARAFVEMGVTKIRITGGEPLTRKNIMTLCDGLGMLRCEGVLQDFTITTNGTQLPRYAAALKAAGVTRLNVSLDTLKPGRFRDITRIGELSKTLAGLQAAKKACFDRIKINSVILKHRNHDEVNNLVDFAVDNGFDISFIEEMPLGVIGNHDRKEAYYSSDEVLSDICENRELIATTETTGGPARYYRIVGTESRIGFISPHSHNFCESCNRVRLTATGRLLLCLGQEHSVDLRRIVRGYPGEHTRLRNTIVDAMQIKPRGHEFDLAVRPIILRHMNVTGG